MVQEEGLIKHTFIKEELHNPKNELDCMSYWIEFSF